MKNIYRYDAYLKVSLHFRFDIHLYIIVCHPRRIFVPSVSWISVFFLLMHDKSSQKFPILNTKIRTSIITECLRPLNVLSGRLLLSAFMETGHTQLYHLASLIRLRTNHVLWGVHIIQHMYPMHRTAIKVCTSFWLPQE